MTLADLDLDDGLPDDELPLPFPERYDGQAMHRAHGPRTTEQSVVNVGLRTTEQSVVNVGLRKAFARKGDDATLTRFVKADPGAVHPKPRQPRMQGFDNPTIEAGRSVFYRHGVHPPRQERPKSASAYRVLVSGHNNAKIGRDVRKGRLAGYWIYTLSLEERATCPRSCEHWGNCYGNGMPYARRIDHRDADALEQAIAADVADILAVKGRVGLLVRLHALGDFPDARYVDFWGGLVERHDRLAVFGYTAHPPASPLGRRIGEWRDRLGFERFAIRHSDGGMDRDCTVSIYDLTAPSNSFICPEQAPGVTSNGDPILCATCGLCWTTRRNVAFVNH